MTGLAFQIGMRPFKQEIRALVVIELPKVPVVGVMAGFAIVAKPVLVWVVRLVTVNTLCRDPGKLLRNVTRLARRCRMQAYQWKRAQIMIKAYIIGPGSLLVTFGTILTQ